MLHENRRRGSRRERG